VHPLQYGLTGLALAIFFLLLLALSEHLGFGGAYALAALGCIGLIATYMGGVLGSRRRGLGFAALLGLLFALLFGLLQSEDYALLIGALALFAALATVMLLTRRLDWYRLGAGGRVG
jgi:inner membrane protein